MDRPLGYSKKVSGELNYGLVQPFIADMDAHFCIFYMYIQIKTSYADYYVLYQILLVTGCFVGCDIIQLNLVGICCICKNQKA